MTGQKRCMRRRFTAEEKKRFVDEVRAGAAVKDVAARIGLNTSMGYRWVRAAEEPSAPRFARVVRGSAPETGSSISIRVGTATVVVDMGFDADLLRAVVTALSVVAR